MIIVLKKGIKQEQYQEVIDMIKGLGYQAHVIKGTERTVIGAVGSERGKDKLHVIENLTGVDRVVPILQPYKLASLEVKPEKTVIPIRNNVKIGGDEVVVIAGPCSVESQEQIIETAKAVKAAGADGLMIEVHQYPDHAESDGLQSLKPERFASMMESLSRFAEATGRSLARAPE